MRPGVFMLAGLWFGHVSKARAAAIEAGHEWFEWNGRVYDVAGETGHPGASKLAPTLSEFFHLHPELIPASEHPDTLGRTWGRDAEAAAAWREEQRKLERDRIAAAARRAAVNLAGPAKLALVAFAKELEAMS